MPVTLPFVFEVPAKYSLPVYLGRSTLYVARAAENFVNSGGGLAAGANTTVYTPPAGQSIQMLWMLIAVDVATKIDVRATAAGKLNVQLRANETKEITLPQPGIAWGKDATINILNSGAAAIVFNASFMFCLDTET